MPWDRSPRLALSCSCESLQRVLPAHGAMASKRRKRGAANKPIPQTPKEEENMRVTGLRMFMILVAAFGLLAPVALIATTTAEAQSQTQRNPTGLRTECLRNHGYWDKAAGRRARARAAGSSRSWRCVSSRRRPRSRTRPPATTSCSRPARRKAAGTTLRRESATPVSVIR